MTGPTPEKTTAAAASAADVPAPASPGLFTEIALCLWFALVIVGFWGAYVGISIAPAVLTALFGLFLIGGAAGAALRYLRHER